MSEYQSSSDDAVSSTFFSGLGDVWWLGRQDAVAQGLIYVNNAGNAILKVDDVSNVAPNQKRNTVCALFDCFFVIF